MPVLTIIYIINLKIINEIIKINIIESSEIKRVERYD